MVTREQLTEEKNFRYLGFPLMQAITPRNGDMIERPGYKNRNGNPIVNTFLKGPKTCKIITNRRIKSSATSEANARKVACKVV